MLPTIRIFGFSVASYGLLILVGLILATPISIKLGEIYGVNAQDTLFASLFGIVGLLVVGKLFYLLTNAQWIWKHWLLIISEPDALDSLFKSGFVFYGGLFGGMYGVAYYCRKYGLSVWRACAVILPSVPLVHAFGRIGCFMAGCCHGIEHGGAFSVSFNQSLVAPNGVPLFPVQLLEAGLNLLLFCILLSVVKREAKGRVVLFTYLTIYSVMRFALEFLRGDLERGMLLGISTSQWISILILVIVSLFTVVGKKKGAIL